MIDMLGEVYRGDPIFCIILRLETKEVHSTSFENAFYILNWNVHHVPF